MTRAALSEYPDAGGGSGGERRRYRGVGSAGSDGGNGGDYTPLPDLALELLCVLNGASSQDGWRGGVGGRVSKAHGVPAERRFVSRGPPVRALFSLRLTAPRSFSAPQLFCAFRSSLRARVLASWRLFLACSRSPRAPAAGNASCAQASDAASRACSSPPPRLPLDAAPPAAHRPCFSPPAAAAAAACGQQQRSCPCAAAGSRCRAMSMHT